MRRALVRGVSADGLAAAMPCFDVGGARVLRGDCFAGMANMADVSVDFVLTDPPYFIDGFDDGWDAAALARRMRHNGAVAALPGGMKYDRRQSARYQKFAAKLAAQALRLLKPGGFFVAFSMARLHHRLAVAAEDAGFEIRDMLAWKYEGQAKAFCQDHFIRKMDVPQARKDEMTALLGGRKTPQLKPQMEPMILAQKPREGTFVENYLRWQTGLMDASASLDGRFPGTVMAVPKPKNGRAQAGGHLTVKPVPLLAHLIRLFSAEGQLVLDPFLGSGTTAIAALQTGRRCVGFEINPDYYSCAVERLQEFAV